MASNDPTQLLFNENNKEDFLAASELLLRLANNVLENPDDSRYRRIRVGNPLVERKLLPVVGGLECLFDMGFLEDGEYLTLPPGSSLATVRHVRDKISNLRSLTNRASNSRPSSTTSDSSSVKCPGQERAVPALTVKRTMQESEMASVPAHSLPSLTVPSPSSTTQSVTTTQPPHSAAQTLPSMTRSLLTATQPPHSAAAQTLPSMTQPLLTATQPPHSTAQMLPSMTQSPPLSLAQLPSSIQRRGPLSANQPVSSLRAQPTQTVEDWKQKESAFFLKLQSTMAHVMLYEDPNLQQKAREMIPVSKLQEEADIKIQSLQQSSCGNTEREVDVRDCLLIELLGWYKKSFFKWVDSPPCIHCGGSTHHVGSVPPTPAEVTWGGSRVENHQCDSCKGFTRFPRYNHPGKLLETRRGRCGEWANCFTLCCRAIGFEARYVLDWTDHVWTEVYSDAQKRWLHCDPCENVCDKPLLYEEGWGKKLTYVIAFSKDDVQDVTWRYSAKHLEVLARRDQCRESWLVNTLDRIFNRSLQSMPERRKQEMLHRLVVELVEFMTPKTAGNVNLPGRTTGSLAWRLARGELGSKESARHSEFVFRLLEDEKNSELLHMKYSCAKDVYVRCSSQDRSIFGWRSCTFSVNSVFKKEESDWKMAYLAREEGTSSGEITWKFDLAGEDLRISKLELKAPCTTFENGSVVWRICADDNCFSVPGAHLNDFQSFDLQRSQALTLTAVLSGGVGDVAWQQAQLFRQRIDDVQFPFEIKLHLS